MLEFHSALLSANERDRQELVTKLAACAGLEIPAGSMGAVTANLVVAASLARLMFEQTPTADELAPATVFTLPAIV